ncbi:inactive dipeptidyl peptidase 10 isoform X2 [Danio rerio]|uniref:Inactive dipeptidyl peptidase 10 isoform X2 n=1 Tax=Danio rerio TaxID=7955 RepID=A0A8M9PLB3_DANRE|nr:inactive dipeptidyl peptidase 10-like isoform X2 [Danio rerio]|eukprot:XP_021325694.1 inactive dipeptidyl peptidase 10-like isoform X2 [Danio rerio]
MIATTQQNMTTELDLGSSGGPPRNWKGIGIAMVVILGVMSLVTLSIFLLTPDESHLLRLSRLTLENLESEDFQIHNPCATWLSEHEVSLCTQEGHVLIHNLSTNLTTTLLDNSTLDLKSMKFQVSADKRFILMAYNIQHVFSQSFTASFAIYIVSSGDIVDLTPSEEDTSVLQYAAWGPQGNQLVYVFENDIYYKPDVSSKAMRLTASGRKGMVVNGLSDWTYEEEILLKYPAFWWAKDGARLAYLSINNSATPFMEIHHFLGGSYPSNVLYPYPKAGSRIPSASLFVVNLYGPAHTLEMFPPDSQNSRDSYISMVSWISSTRLTVRWLNRVQNQSVLCVCEATTGACSERHQMAMDFWHNNQRQEEPLFTADGSLFYLILPAKQGARGEFLHIASLPAQASSPSVSPRFLTSGNWDVISLCALDEENDKIYFLSAEESQQSRHLYSVELGGVFHRQCLTCNLFERCSFFRADFSPNQTYFTLYCLGPGVPKVTIHSTSDPFRYTVVEDNSVLAMSLETKQLPETLYHTLSSDNSDLDVKMSLPPGYEGNLHPLLIIIDSIPGRPSVTEEFALGWPEVLSSMHGVALAWIDSRSRISQTQKSSTLDPRKLGSLRIKDKLGVVEWLMKLPYIDAKRIAVYGKGFGGYLGLKMLTGTDQMFRCAAVMAPITDFKLYSAAFSERFLGLPAKEEHSYMTASLLDDIHKLKDENFLLIHGTADARVHFQHSAELLSRLVKVEANYTLQLYPDEGHTLREERSQQHLHRTILHYLHNCLKYDPFLNIEEEEEDEEEEE